MAISQADRDWFCDRLRENWTSLYRLARSITGSDADAQEVMAQAAYLAWARFGQLRQREKFRFWLLKIAANEARQLCRRRGRTVPLEELGTEPPLRRGSRRTTASGRRSRPCPVTSGRRWCCFTGKTCPQRRSPGSWAPRRARCGCG